MLRNPSTKYRAFAPIALVDRAWPNRVLTAPPRGAAWICATATRRSSCPWTRPEARMFHTLVKIGFKEIEVGFPSASKTDFDFVRELIEQRLPEDVSLQVLMQARAI